ncbi:MAG: UDP-N-acetylmuramoyl-L-alanine--D-glutamate ligase [Rhabdochlamydiaceae bacterium]|nr:UDP-N-acetylmuramoyl-L-alanine--D-glutamate ligase [Rhabdochlamydiaceae bacterium]
MIKSLIIGLGKSGLAAYDLLEKEGDDVYGFDDNPTTLQKHEASGKKIAAAPNVKEFDRLILSPGVSPTHHVIVQAVKSGVPLIGEAELALERLRQPAIAITGTNGKTTVTLLIAHVLECAGFSAQALGNVGQPLSAYVGSAKEGEIAVIELSSFQLDTLSAAFFDLGLILNITPDHLDRYDSMVDYAKSKCRLQYCLKPKGELWVHEHIAKDFKELLKVPYRTYGQNRDCTLSADQVAFLGKYTAEHELENTIVAWIACRKFGVSEEAFRLAAQSFKKPLHRIEWVASIDGVDYINDSKGTNIDATIKAVEAMNKPILLITGGVDKGFSYDVWKKPFAKKVRHVVAMGEAAKKIAQELKPDFQVPILSSLSEAVLHCTSIAREGEVVMLSPGCSSYDMFRDYADRGNEFKRIVYLLQEKKG